MNDYVDKGEFTVGKGFYFCRQPDGEFIDYKAIVSFKQWKDDATNVEMFRNKETGKTEAWNALIDESHGTVMRTLSDGVEYPYTTTRYDLKPEIIKWLDENVGPEKYGVTPHKPDDNDSAYSFCIFFSWRRDATKFAEHFA